MKQKNKSKRKGCGGCLGYGIAGIIGLSILASLFSSPSETVSPDISAQSLDNQVVDASLTETVTEQISAQEINPDKVFDSEVSATPEVTEVTVVPSPTQAVEDVQENNTATSLAIDVSTSTPAPTSTPFVEQSVLPQEENPESPGSSFYALQNANLRSGPSTGYAIVGSAVANELLNVIGQNAEGSWLQLNSGHWVSTSLVQGDISGLSVINSLEAIQQPQPEVQQPEVQQDVGDNANNANAFTCINGCATPPDPSCAIKGNVNSSGERIYHSPGGSFYERTDIKPEEGDRWFCTSQEAVEAGFRPSQR